MQRRVLHRFVMMAKRQMPARVGDQADSSEDKAAQEGSCIFCFLLVACKFMMKILPSMDLINKWSMMAMVFIISGSPRHKINTIKL